MSGHVALGCRHAKVSQERMKGRYVGVCRTGGQRSGGVGQVERSCRAVRMRLVTVRSASRRLVV